MDNLPHRNLFNLGSNHDGKEAFIAISPINTKRISVIDQ